MKHYRSIRSQIRSGDVITWEGRGPVSWLIRRWSHRSHASMCIDFADYRGDDRRYLLEAWEGEFNIRLLSKRLQNYSGKAFWHQLNPELDPFRRMIEYNAFSLIGTGYDYQSLFLNAICKVNTKADLLFCSEAPCHVFTQSIPLKILKGYRGSRYANMMIDGVALRPGGIARLPLFLDEVEIIKDEEE